MRKLLIAAVLGLVALPFGAAHAELAYCLALGEGDAQAHECTFNATDTTVTYFVDTPNEWEVYTIRYDEFGRPYRVTFAEGGTATPPTVADSATPAILGEQIHVWINRDCVPPFNNPCGNVGWVGALTNSD